MDIDNATLVRRLREIGNLFDIGCEIIVGDDGIGIDGIDYASYTDPSETHITISRAYHVPFEYNDETGELADTLTPVLEQIRRDREKVNGMVSKA